MRKNPFADPGPKTPYEEMKDQIMGRFAVGMMEDDGPIVVSYSTIPFDPEQMQLGDEYNPGQIYVELDKFQEHIDQISDPLEKDVLTELWMSLDIDIVKLHARKLHKELLQLRAEELLVTSE